MDPTKRIGWDFPFERSSAFGEHPTEAHLDAGPSNVLRVVGSADELEGEASRSRKRPVRDWSKLIDRIRDAAKHTREVEAQSREQELRVQKLLDRAREDLKAAVERVRAADARVAEMQARSEALLKAADERVKSAEARARIAEEWLARVYETVDSEFTVERDTNDQDTKQIA